MLVRCSTTKPPIHYYLELETWIGADNVTWQASWVDHCILQFIDTWGGCKVYDNHFSHLEANRKQSSKVDIRAAFDSVSHLFLWLLLKSVGVPDKRVKMLRVLYDKFSSCVWVGLLTSWFKIMSGVCCGPGIVCRQYGLAVRNVSWNKQECCDVWTNLLYQSVLSWWHLSACWITSWFRHEVFATEAASLGLRWNGRKRWFRLWAVERLNPRL